MNKDKVILGMSGGTDSSVAAMMLQEKGYEVVGVTFRFYEKDNNMAYLDDAKETAARLGIRHIVVDCREEFRNTIVKYFLSSYIDGETPVPCTLCNNQFKWRLLIELADKEGAYWVASGHYINKVCRDDLWYVSPANDSDKDQSFFMWGLKQDVLSRMLLPMGGITKHEVREYARERGFLKVSTKRDSLGVCFCPGDYRSFLTSEVDASLLPGEGRFVDEDGNVLGSHKGYPFYTIGQRRGLGIHLNKAVFVKDVDKENNIITLAPLKSLYKTVFWLRDYNLISPTLVIGKDSVIVKIRYRKQANLCRVSYENNLLRVDLIEPLESIANGQAAAFYDAEGILLGGGIITDCQ